MARQPGVSKPGRGIAADCNEKRTAPGAVLLHVCITRLRAGVPVAVVTHIGSRSRIVGTVGLHAVGDVVVASTGRDLDRSFRVVVVIVVGIAAVIRATAVVGPLGSDRAADHGAGNRARNEAAATAMAISSATTAGPVTAAATAVARTA